MAQDTISFQVNYKGRIIPLESWSLDNTVHELKEFLAKSIGMPSEFQKLLYKGSSPEDIQNIKLADSKVIHQPFNKSKSKFAINPYKDIRNKESTLSEHNYTFHNIQVIEQFPESGKARVLLEKLRDDNGIREIMKKYKWNVGTLRELSPVEKDILGFNKNRGELITLRLRTDDMEGFRHYPEIRRVLLHELVHNVWGDHDDNFHRLNRQLNKEVGKFFFNILVELDWTASGGHKISNDEFYNAPEEEAIDEKSWQGGTFVLGGVGTDRRLTKRELLAEATLMRLTKEEKELDDNCGSK
ncbi:17783_t:CDS:2 [Funneliformis caledonium]|uniref:17783_t:CDS:1 n=1 Tax=Funneliformis caledonium TaxID=1117310 RepID=A0A9N8VMV2_9GLOM|nr:17783_t:CDS:2 [Funneliformis caledonium]